MKIRIPEDGRISSDVAVDDFHISPIWFPWHLLKSWSLVDITHPYKKWPVLRMVTSFGLDLRPTPWAPNTSDFHHALVRRFALEAEGHSPSDLYTHLSKRCAGLSDSSVCARRHEKTSWATVFEKFGFFSSDLLLVKELG